jgi:uncharacterized membrane protein
MDRKNGLMIVGIFLVAIGVLGFAFPLFTTQRTEDIIGIGDLKLQNVENISHRVPALLSGGLLLIGAVLIGSGANRKT